MSNVVVGFFGGIPTYVAALVEQSPMMMAFGAMLTFVFFLLGKAVDVGIKLYLDRRLERKRLNGIKNSSDSDGN